MIVMMTIQRPQGRVKRLRQARQCGHTARSWLTTLNPRDGRLTNPNSLGKGRLRKTSVLTPSRNRVQARSDGLRNIDVYFAIIMKTFKTLISSDQIIRILSGLKQGLVIMPRHHNEFFAIFGFNKLNIHMLCTFINFASVPNSQNIENNEVFIKDDAIVIDTKTQSIRSAQSLDLIGKSHGIHRIGFNLIFNLFCMTFWHLCQGFIGKSTISNRFHVDSIIKYNKLFKTVH
jgi:hypothetical protein